MAFKRIGLWLAAAAMPLIVQPASSQINEADRQARCQNNRDALARLQAAQAGYWSDAKIERARDALAKLNRTHTWLQETQRLGLEYIQARDAFEAKARNETNYELMRQYVAERDSAQIRADQYSKQALYLAEAIHVINQSMGINCRSDDWNCDYTSRTTLGQQIDTAMRQRSERDQAIPQMQAHQTNLIALQCDRPSTGYALADPYGTRWSESEGGWSGDWVRRGNSNVFDASWGGGSVRAVLTISISGNQVSVDRQSATDGNNCQYQGTLQGNAVSGTYRCTSGGGEWRATIR